MIESKNSHMRHYIVDNDEIIYIKTMSSEVVDSCKKSLMLMFKLMKHFESTNVNYNLDIIKFDEIKNYQFELENQRNLRKRTAINYQEEDANFDDVNDADYSPIFVALNVKSDISDSESDTESDKDSDYNPQDDADDVDDPFVFEDEDQDEDGDDNSDYDYEDSETDDRVDKQFVSDYINDPDYEEDVINYKLKNKNKNKNDNCDIVLNGGIIYDKDEDFKSSRYEKNTVNKINKNNVINMKLRFYENEM